MNDRAAELLRNLPDKPGVYLYRNAAGTVLYVGKAKSLRQRVRSYFQGGASHPPRTQKMLEELDGLEIIVTATEVEALILENNLIKRERPRFNVILRDDKTYPYLRLTIKDDYPRVSLVRRAKLDGSLYFGPYLPSSLAWKTLRMIPKFFRVAICHVKLDGTQRPCLYYHLGQCLAPCAGFTTVEEYREAATQTRMFLEGRTAELVTTLQGRMEEASNGEDFELAAHYRDLIASIAGLSERQAVSSRGLEDLDLLAAHREDGEVALQLFQMREGRIQSRREFFFENVEEPPELLYQTVIEQYYAAASELPGGICVPVALPERELLERWLAEKAGRKVPIRTARRGFRRRLLDLVMRNAKQAFEFRFRSELSHGVSVLDELRDLLGLDGPPYRIECFDISNIQGTDQVASMVVWEGGRPRKSDYRRFKVRTVEGADDFRAIAEVVGRRYTRLMREGKRLPDLVLLDGGKGQLSSAAAVLDGLGLGEVPVASIAKKQEEIFIEGSAEPIALARDSRALHLIQRLRDEAHRFAITYHRSLRGRRTITSELLEVPGVGPATAKRLLRAFGSVEGLRRAGLEEIEARFGPRLAGALKQKFPG